MKKLADESRQIYGDGSKLKVYILEVSGRSHSCNILKLGDFILLARQKKNKANDEKKEKKTTENEIYIFAWFLMSKELIMVRRTQLFFAFLFSGIYFPLHI